MIESTINTIDRFDKHSSVNLGLTDIPNVDEFDDEGQNTDDLFSLGKKVKIDLADMDYVSWRESLAKDAEVLELLTLMVGDIKLEHDSKLQELYRFIDNKIAHPINEGNKKIIIFTAFADTAGYLYENVSKYVKEKYGLKFEQEYINVLNDYVTLLETPYQKYLKSTCSDVGAVHKGYFSIDKKGHAVDSRLKRGSEFSDDISAYDLILKNKERLLSFDEPTRFIFSHSALREGWDNPNVFQICTLKHSDSNTAKR